MVIGGGQAGLAVGYHLAKHGHNFVILDAHARVGDAWRTRWEGLRLFTLGPLEQPPGHAVSWDRHAFPTKDEVADYLEAYVERMALPVRTASGSTTCGLPRMADGFRVVASERDYLADQVVVATGAYDRPRIPDFAGELDPSDHRSSTRASSGHLAVARWAGPGRRRQQLGGRDRPDGGERAPTVLCGRDVGKMPFRPEDRLAQVFDTLFWFFVNHVATLDKPIGRKAASEHPRSRTPARPRPACGPRRSWRGARHPPGRRRPGRDAPARRRPGYRGVERRLGHGLPPGPPLDPLSADRTRRLADATARTRHDRTGPLLHRPALHVSRRLGAPRWGRPGCRLPR